MKAETAEKRLAKLLGLEDKLEELTPKEPTAEEKVASHEAEAVLRFMYDPDRFTTRSCKNCELSFTVDYPCVAYCSDRCRKVALHEIGIEWDPTKSPYERWQGTVPLTVPPQALEIVEALRPVEDAEAG